MLLKTFSLSYLVPIAILVTNLPIVCGDRAITQPARSTDRGVIRSYQRGGRRFFDIRDKRGAKFDWQKDEESDEEMDPEISRKRRKEMVYDENIPIYSPNGTMTYEMMLFGEHREERKKDDKETKKAVNTTEVRPKSREEKNKSDIKAILWDMKDEDEEADTNESDHEKPAPSKITTSTTAAAMPPKLQPTTSIGSSGDTKKTDHMEAAIKVMPLVETTTHGKSAVAMPSTKPTTENSVKSDILSVSEDMIRVYTLDPSERYGHGGAKPRVITNKLAKLKFEEYKGDNTTTTTSSSLASKEEAQLPQMRP